MTLVGEAAGTFTMILISGKLLPPAMAWVLVHVAVWVVAPKQLQVADVFEKFATV